MATDTVREYCDTKFYLRLQNNTKYDIQLVRLVYDSDISFECRPGSLPVSIPAGQEVSIPIKMWIANLTGWYEGTAKFTFSDGSIETLSRKIYAKWKAPEVEAGIIRQFKDPFSLDIPKGRIFIERREVKADVRFVAHYPVQLWYRNTSNDTLFISKIDYNEKIVSWYGVVPDFLPPGSSSALVIMLELGKTNQFDETIVLHFTNHPPEEVRVKLFVNYHDDNIMIRLDSLCDAPLFGGKLSEYHSEIAFNNYVHGQIDGAYFESIGIYGSGSTLVCSFIIDNNGQIKDISCGASKFPELEASIKKILAKSPPWKPSKCAPVMNGNNSKAASSKYQYLMYFRHPMEPSTCW